MATIEQNLTQLVQDRDDLVTNLTTKGITGLTGDETFTELVPEVLNIPTGTDWSAIGYNEAPEFVQDNYDYAKDIYDNWDNTETDYHEMFLGGSMYYMPFVDTSNGTDFSGMFYSCIYLTTVPQFDTSNGTNFSEMFKNCYKLSHIPLLDTSNGTDFHSMFDSCMVLTEVPNLDTSNCTDFSRMFFYCVELTTIPQLDTSKATKFESMFGETDTYVTFYSSNLSNTSLNNILAMLTNAILYTGTKTLKYIGLSPSQATTCTTLSNWSACQAAGWTTGY